ncbi:serine carboxypeptidase 1 [Panicum miliaceum]|uniref:Carboxypeptidase n=1 Tax=Panicum miliaceum TaxID=4540 RepID=A0A3L6T303_PANMI|nr:serine carboxypeptidase 1 [Panicum miliaceum]
MACSASAPSSAPTAAALVLLVLASFVCSCRSAPPDALVFKGQFLSLGVLNLMFFSYTSSYRSMLRHFTSLVSGPFNFESGGSAGSLPKLHLNPYSWSKVSSVIYLDSPVGVGLSYAKDKSKAYTTGDLQTAKDSHTFLLEWFQLYPEFQTNPFYIAGESYAGIYIPTLSHEVVRGINEEVKPTINFKVVKGFSYIAACGYMVGNSICDTVFDGNALVPFPHGMGLISDDMYKETSTACHRNYWNDSSDECRTALLNVDTVIAGLNIYDILEPCYHSKNTKKNDEVATAWLNNDSVRSAIHAEPASSIGPWVLCTNALLNFDHDAGSMVIYHKNLTSQGYRALNYSGDHDMCVPYTGTEAWTASLGYGIIDSWRPWIADEEVSGYTQVYENGLTFATIKGAGHTVPEYKPQEAFAFYSRWLTGSKL